MLFVRAPLFGLALAGSALALSACNREPAQSDDFAQRIGATGKADPAVAAESEAAVQAGARQNPQKSTSASKGPYADLIVPPSVQLDAKAAAPCKAVAMSKFLGQPDSPEFRRNVTAENKAGGGVRFLAPGTQVAASEKPTRLNVMFDATQVARDFRCG